METKKSIYRLYGDNTLMEIMIFYRIFLSIYLLLDDRNDHFGWERLTSNASTAVLPSLDLPTPLGIPSGYDCYSSPWLSHGPNRNRWFTELKNGDGFPWLCNKKPDGILLD
jgi:hypothetical protein